MPPVASWFRRSCAPPTNITRDTLLLGMGSHFELWDKATHDAKEAEALAASTASDALQDLAF